MRSRPICSATASALGSVGFFVVNNDMALSAAIKAHHAGIDVTVVDVETGAEAGNAGKAKLNARSLRDLGVPIYAGHTS